MIRPMTTAELLSLPVSVPLPVAARAFGMGRHKAYERVRAGDFPCRVIQVGERGWVVPRSALLEALGIDPSAVMVDGDAAAVG